MLHDLAVIADDIRVFIEYLGDEKQVPHPIPGNILSVLKRFKKDYEAKNITLLRKLISDDYTSNIGSGQTKEEFILYFKQAFQLVPRWANLKLKIDIFQVLENNENTFKAIIDFDSDIAIGFIPLKHWDFGKHLCVELAPEGEHGIWKIKRIIQT